MSASAEGGERAVRIAELLARPPAELLAEATKLGIPMAPNLEHDQVALALVEHHLDGGAGVDTEGVLALLPDGFGFVRQAAWDFAASAVDAYVGPAQVRALNLRHGQRLRGPIRAPKGNENFLALQRIEAVQDTPVERLATTPPFASRTPILATRPLDLPATDDEMLTLKRLAPWCYGHRVLVTAPPARPRAAVLARLATGLRTSDANARISACLLEQRPEDLAAVRGRLAALRVEVVGTVFAAPPSRHVELARLCVAAAQREVEHGADVVLLIDSLTALVRAAGRAHAPSGTWACPGLDATALQLAQEVFASARQCAEGGSLTVIATAAVDARSAIDALVQRECAFACNSAVAVDAELADQPFDLLQTGTRPEDDPRPAAERERWLRIRDGLQQLDPSERQRRWRSALQRDVDPARPADGTAQGR